LEDIELKELLEFSPNPKNAMEWPWKISKEQEIKPPNCSNLLPKISIITPSFNQGKFIEETIRSVLLQNYPNLEYILIDGGSTDDTLEIVDKYKRWISYFQTGPDSGQADAIARGFEKATGEILAWINSDDRYQPNALLRVAKFFDEYNDCVFGNGDVNYIDEGGRLISRIYAIKPNPFITSNIGVHGWPQPGCFWRKSTYEMVGGIDRNLQFCMDRDLFIRLAHAGKAKRIPGGPLADFRIHGNAKTSRWKSVAQVENKLLINRYGSKYCQVMPGVVRLLWFAWTVPRRFDALYDKIRA